MKRLSTKEIMEYTKQINGNHERLYSIPARVEWPIGEMENLAGFFMGWKMLDEMPAIEPITEKDRFSAQGLEGKHVKHTSIVEAVIIWNQCADNRCQIFV
jgi:hypothetical protein